MTKLYWCEIADGLPVPDFGEALQAHIQKKKHPQVLRAGLSAWNLLALALREAGCEALPRVMFLENGKPCFEDGALHFSLSHSGGIAAALISDAPCGVDAEAIREDVRDRLRFKCMTEAEIAAGRDFFEIWTRKECIAKLDGRGITGKTLQINTLDEAYAGRFFSRAIADSAGNKYMISALCENAGDLTPEKRTLIEG